MLFACLAGTGFGHSLFEDERGRRDFAVKESGYSLGQSGTYEYVHSHVLEKAKTPALRCITGGK